MRLPCLVSSVCMFLLHMDPKWPENQGAPSPRVPAPPSNPHIPMSLSGPIQGAALRMLPMGPIERLWSALALSLLTQPPTGVVAPDLGLLLNWSNHLGELKSNLHTEDSGDSVPIPSARAHLPLQLRFTEGMSTASTASG